MGVRDRVLVAGEDLAGDQTGEVRHVDQKQSRRPRLAISRIRAEVERGGGWADNVAGMRISGRNSGPAPDGVV
jgi:hypothetical protein